MSHSHSQINILLIVVAILAVVGGLAIVVVTSPQSWQLGPVAWLQSRAGTSTPDAALVTTGRPSPSPAVASATATVPPATKAPAVTVTSVPATSTATLEQTATLTATQVLPADVIALAVVVVEGASKARVRDKPNGDLLVAAVEDGTQVQVLAGNIDINDVHWLQIRLPDGQEGWIADFLLRITQTRS